MATELGRHEFQRMSKPDRAELESERWSEEEWRAHEGLGSDEESEEEDEGEEESDADTTPADEQVAVEPLAPLPEHLTPPLNIQLHILGWLSHPAANDATDRRAFLWVEGRQVCSSYRDFIEREARDKWTKDLCFCGDGGMERTSHGKVHISLRLEFQRFATDDPNMALFKDTDISPNFARACQRCFNRGEPLDAVFGTFVHDVEIKGTVCSTKQIELRVPWKSMIGHLVAEERKVQKLQAVAQHRFKDTMRQLHGTDAMADPERIMKIITGHMDNQRRVYTVVRAKRLGFRDPAGDDRLLNGRIQLSDALEEKYNPEEED